MSCLERIGRLGIDITGILFKRTVNYNMVFRLNPLHPDLIESLSFGSVFSYLSEKFDQTVIYKPNSVQLWMNVLLLLKMTIRFTKNTKRQTKIAV